MRNFSISLFTLIAVFSACKPKNHFTISGKISNAPSASVITLSRIVNNAPLPLDSVQLDSDGKYKLSSVASPSEVFVVSLGRRSPHIQIIVNPGDQFEVNADARALIETYEVKGSKESELVAELTHHFLRVQHSIDSLQKYYDKIIQKDTTRAVREKRSAEIMKIGNTFRTYRKAFIDKNKNNMACLYALQGLNPDTDFDYFTIVDSVLLRNFVRADQVQQFHRFYLKISEKRKAYSQNEKMTSIGMPAPEISLPTPAGQTISLSSLRGKVVLIDFWASWCGPCRVENKHLKDLYEKYSEKGFEILQVSIDTKRKDWIDAIKKDDLPWINISDLKANTAAVMVYNVQSIPQSVLVGKDGKIIGKSLRGEDLEKKLEELF